MGTATTVVLAVLAAGVHSTSAKQVSISNALPRYNVTGDIMDAVRALIALCCRLSVADPFSSSSSSSSFSFSLSFSSFIDLLHTARWNI
jgi:hypothetical protein